MTTIYLASRVVELEQQIEKYREFVAWVAAHNLVTGKYADDDHPYDEWVTPARDEMDFGDVVERAQEVLR